MRPAQRLSSLLRSGGLWPHYLMGRLLKAGVKTQSWVLGMLAAVAVIVASIIDGSFVLAGRAVGLLEHPAIWGFLGLQVAVPLVLIHSFRRLLRSRHRLRVVGSPRSMTAEAIVQRVLEFVQIRSLKAKAAASLMYSVGLAVFVWNTYQNQLPGILLPYDFWDSGGHPWGFWVTRVYKFYLFVILLPYVGLVHTAILVAILGEIRRARLRGQLHLDPFHTDGVGGLGFVPGLVSTPVIVGLLIASVPLAGAFAVHRALDVTPVVGLSIVLVAATAAYGLPTLYLRRDIVALKTTMLEKLRKRQRSYYTSITDQERIGSDLLQLANEALDYFEKVCAKIQSISDYPHIRRLARFTAVALTPSVLVKAIQLALPLITRSLGTP